MTDNQPIELLRLLAARLERLSVDSRWARRASGLRGNIIKIMNQTRYQPFATRSTILTNVETSLPLPWPLLAHKCPSRNTQPETSLIENPFLLQNQTLPCWQLLGHSTGHDRFRKIFLDHWDRYCDLRLADEVPFNQQAYVRDIIQRMLLCRDPDGGYARWVCPGCQYEHRVPFSCKTRFCPSCGKVRVDNWVNNITKDILEVPHLHITLTTDDSFRPFFRRDSRLLKELLRVGAQAVQEVISDLYPGMRIGLVYTAHTAGRDLGYKPHVHLVITKGDLLDGKWVEIVCVPGDRLSAKWRYLLCKRLCELCPSDTVLQQMIAKTYHDHHGFMVHTESFYPKGIEAARYIVRYLGHPPLATSHLTDYDGKTVTFWYKDTQTDEKIVVRYSALNFISYLIPYIPPKGLQMVRYAGLYARCVKRRCLDIANAALEAMRAQIPLFALDPWLKSVVPLKWRDRIKASFGYDPLSCPFCGRTMELVEIWEPKRGFVWMQRWLETPADAQGRQRRPERGCAGQTTHP